jgi:hypothetical protein
MCMTMALTLLSAALFGCGAQSDAAGPLDEIEGDAASEGVAVEALGVDDIPNSDGMNYAASDTKKVYHTYGGSKFCWIYDPGQLDALDGTSPGGQFGPSGAVGDQAFRGVMSRYGRAYTGHCKYPTGCFKRKSSAPAYYVNASANQYCWIQHIEDVPTYCGSVRGILNIKRSDSNIKFDQRNWFDANNVLHTSARYAYTGYCP